MKEKPVREARRATELAVEKAGRLWDATIEKSKEVKAVLEQARDDPREESRLAEVLGGRRRLAARSISKAARIASEYKRQTLRAKGAV